MNKIVNKALFYKEWVYVRWVTLLTTLILLYFKVYGVISALNREKMYGTRQGWVLPDRWFNNGLYGGDSDYNNYLFIMVFVVIILAITLFIGEKTSETQGFIASMPFTRKEIILNKWFVGVVSLLIIFLVTHIFLSLFYLKNINLINTTLNPYFDIVKWVFMDTFQYICIFTFIMLAQAVMGNSIVSGIVGGIILVVPFFLSIVKQNLIFRYFGHAQYRFMIFDKICQWLNIYDYNYPNSNYLGTAVNGMFNISYTNYKSKLLVLFILTCLFLYLAYVAYKKRNVEYNLRLIVFKKLEPAFIWGFTICIGLLAGTIFGSDLLREFGIWFVIFTIIGYFMSKLLLKVLTSRK